MTLTQQQAGFHGDKVHMRPTLTLTLTREEHAEILRAHPIEGCQLKRNMQLLAAQFLMANPGGYVCVLVGRQPALFEL